FAVFFQLFVHCENGNVIGKIIDGQTKEGLPGVAIKSENVATRTNLHGDYNLQLTTGKKVISIRQQGYKTVDTVVTIISGVTITLNITLLPENLELDVVVVSAGRYEQKIEDVSVSMSIIKSEL